VALASRAQAVFSWKTFAVPNARVMHCMPLDDGRLEEDPARKEGEDVWLGVLTYQVMAQRAVP
jgi:hypothetical protein